MKYATDEERKEALRARRRAYRQANLEKRRAENRAYYRRNREVIRARQAAYYLTRTEEKKEAQRQRMNERNKDPVRKAQNLARTRAWIAAKKARLEAEQPEKKDD